MLFFQINSTNQIAVINNNKAALYFQIILYLIEYASIGVSFFFYGSIIHSFYNNSKLSQEELNSVKKTFWLNLRYPILQLCFLIPSSLIILICNAAVPQLTSDNAKYKTTDESQSYL